MSTGRLRTYVHVRDARGVAHLLGPDDQIPEWAARRITNPGAWATPPRLDDQPDSSGPGDKPGRPDGRASRDAWAAYAASIDLEVQADATKAEIVEAVRAAEAAAAGDKP